MGSSIGGLGRKLKMSFVLSWLEAEMPEVFEFWLLNDFRASVLETGMLE